MSNRVDDVAFEPEGLKGAVQDARRDHARHGEIGAKPVSKADEMIALINDRKRRETARR